MDTVTYCISWTSGGQAKTQCTDVKSSDANEQVTRDRALALAKARMDATEAPDTGTTLLMERFVGALPTPFASVSVGADWQVSFKTFEAACTPQ